MYSSIATSNCFWMESAVINSGFSPPYSDNCKCSTDQSSRIFSSSLRTCYFSFLRCTYVQLQPSDGLGIDEIYLPLQMPRVTCPNPILWLVKFATEPFKFGSCLSPKSVGFITIKSSSLLAFSPKATVYIRTVRSWCLLKLIYRPFGWSNMHYTPSPAKKDMNVPKLNSSWGHTVLIYTVPNAIVFSQIFPWLIVKPKSTAHSWSILTKAAKQFPPFKEAATATYVPPKYGKYSIVRSSG